MIRRGFLDRESRKDLIELARDGSAAHRLARRANALVESLHVDAASTIRPLILIQAMYPSKRLIHLFLDNARYHHHAHLVQNWLAQPGCRIRLHFIPSYCPHLNPIERLWGLMHKHTTHNRCHPLFIEFASAIISFLLPARRCP